MLPENLHTSWEDTSRNVKPASFLAIPRNGGTGKGAELGDKRKVDRHKGQGRPSPERMFQTPRRTFLSKVSNFKSYN